MNCITLLYQCKAKKDKAIAIPFDTTNITFFQEFENLLRYFKDSINLLESDSFGLESFKDSVLSFTENSTFLVHKLQISKNL